MRQRIKLAAIIISVALSGGQLLSPLQNPTLQKQMRALEQQGFSFRILDNTTIEVTNTISGEHKVKTLVEPDEASIRSWAASRGVPILEIDPTQVDTTQWTGWYRYWTTVPVTNTLGTPTVVADANRDGLVEVYGVYRDFTSMDFESRAYQIDSLGLTSLVANYIPRQGNSRQMVDADSDSLIEVTFTIAGQLNDFEQQDRHSFPSRMNFSHERYERGSPGYTGIYLGNLDCDNLMDFLYKGTEVDSTDPTRGIGKTYVAEYDPEVNNFRRVWSRQLSRLSETWVGGYAVGDFDADRRKEFVASELFGQVHVVENTGDNDYVEIWTDSLPFVNMYYQGAGDVDNDGIPEFFVGATMSNGNWTTMYEADSNNHYSPKFIFHLLSGGALDEPTYIVADVDGDGVPELVLLSGLDLYMFKSDRTNSYYLWYLKRERSKLTMQVYDFNGDGKMDFMIGKSITDPQGRIRLYSDLYKADRLTDIFTEDVRGMNNTPKLQVFPIPANPTVEMRYTLRRSQRVLLKVFDGLGKEVTTLFDGVQSGGQHTIRWNAYGASSGIYFVQLQTLTQTITAKALVLR